MQGMALACFTPLEKRAQWRDGGGEGAEDRWGERLVVELIYFFLKKK